MLSNRTQRVVFVLGMVCVVWGCANQTPAISFTRSRPAPADVAGTWTPTENSLHDLGSIAGNVDADPQLVLRTDGSFSATDLPEGWTDASGKSHVQLASGSGTWQVTTTGQPATYVVEMLFPGRSQQLPLSGEKAPYRIHIPLGDSDKYAVLEKTSP